MVQAIVLYLFLSTAKAHAIINLADPDCNAPWEPEWNSFIETNLMARSYLIRYNPSVKYWQAVIKSLAKAESCLNLTERFKEPGLGKDAVTNLPVYSEGLLQMSYQDSFFHGCAFNWERDKYLDPKSYDRTIFQPKNNIECGLILLDKQIHVRQVLFTDGKPYYWSTLDKKNLRHKVFKYYLDKELGN